RGRSLRGHGNGDVSIAGALVGHEEGRGDQAVVSHREHGDGGLALDLAPLAEHAGAAGSDEDAGPGHAANGVQHLVGGGKRVARDEDEDEVGVIRAARGQRVERGLQRGVGGRGPDGQAGAGGDHLVRSSRRARRAPAATISDIARSPSPAFKSTARLASSRTTTSKPSFNASSTVALTQEAGASPPTKQRVTPRSPSAAAKGMPSSVSAWKQE